MRFLTPQVLPNNDRSNKTKNTSFGEGMRIAVIAGFVIGVSASSALAYDWAPLAGSPGGGGDVDGTGIAARFSNPSSVATDGDGNVYVADYLNHTVRKINEDGDVTTIAGKPGVPGSANGNGAAARFNHPAGVVVDRFGDVFVSDSYNHVIRKIKPNGDVTTFAGKPGVSGSVNGIGTGARFKFPRGLTVDADFNFYVADSGNHTIRKMSVDGDVYTLAGSAGKPGSTDATGSLARFSSPTGVDVDGANNVFVADRGNHTIRKISGTGVVTTFAGKAKSMGSINGKGAAARFTNPSTVSLDAGGNMFVGESNDVRRVSKAGTVTTFAGTAIKSGSIDGTGSAARFGVIYGVATGLNGSIYVADTFNDTIRRISSSKVVTTTAGEASARGAIDDNDTDARFYSPKGVTESAGVFYVADTENHTIRRISAGGAVTTIAGLAGNFGFEDGTGEAARFRNPTGIVADSGGNIYVADFGNHTIRKITSAGVVTTVAGSAGIAGSADGTGGAALFNHPKSITIGTGGDLFVADYDNHTIRQVTTAGVVTTLVGTALSSGYTDDTGAAARFFGPSGVSADASGNIYVADKFNNAIRKVSPAGVVTTVLDDAGDALALQAPLSVAVDSTNALFITESSTRVVRQVSSTGVMTIIGGSLQSPGNQAGTDGAARFYSPESIFVTSTNRLVLTNAHAIILGIP